MQVFNDLQSQAGEAAAALLSQYVEAIVRSVATLTDTGERAITSDGQLRAILDTIDRRLAEMTASAGRLYTDATTRLAEGIGHQMLDTYGGFGRSTVGKLESATAAFQRDGNLIGTAGFREWFRKFQEPGFQLRGLIEKDLTRAQVLGMSQTELANTLLRHPEFQFANLPPVTERGMTIFTRGGSLGESGALANRARVIARTELQGITVDMHLAWTKNAGFEKYINVNPMDERTTLGCAEASQQPAMTLAEWRGWMGSDGQGGIPPRKPNCRSSLFALPNQALLTAAELAASGQHFQ
jgi:hypothetical protein